MKLRDYVPKLYENNGNMQMLTYSEEQEFENNLKPAMLDSFKDNFPKIATIHGIENFEKLLNIIPNDSEDLEFRRQRILFRLISQLPFTERYLQSKLDEIIGKNTNSDFTPSNPNNTQWYYILDYQDCTLDLYLTVPGRAWLNELYNFFDSVLPCNIDWYGLDRRIHICYASWQQVKESFTSWNDISSMTWDYVKSAMWI